MIKEIRDKYLKAFTEKTYANFLAYFNNLYDKKVEFRIAESPVFIPKELKELLIEAGNEILMQSLTPDYLLKSEQAIPHGLKVPNEHKHPHFIAIDFAICKDDNGNYLPQLIELQGFASLFSGRIYCHALMTNIFKYLMASVIFLRDGTQRNTAH